MVVVVVVFVVVVVVVIVIPRNKNGSVTAEILLTFSSLFWLDGG